MTSRDPVAWWICALGSEAEKWTLTAWSKNLTNKIYNAEFSPGNRGADSCGGPCRAAMASIWTTILRLGCRHVG